MNTTSSLFSQPLIRFPRIEFENLVNKYGAKRNTKGFRCRTQFVSMLFCHLAHSDSLLLVANKNPQKIANKNPHPLINLNGRNNMCQKRKWKPSPPPSFHQNILDLTLGREKHINWVKRG